MDPFLWKQLNPAHYIHRAVIPQPAANPNFGQYSPISSLSMVGNVPATNYPYEYVYPTLYGGGPSSARSGAAQGGPSSGYNGVPGTSAQTTTAKKRSVHSKGEQSRAKKVKRDPSDSDQ